MEENAEGKPKDDPFAELRNLEALVDSRALATKPRDEAAPVPPTAEAAHAGHNGGSTVKEIDERFNDPRVAAEFLAGQREEVDAVDAGADLGEFARAGLITAGAAIRKLSHRADAAGQANLAAALRSIADFQTKVGRAIEGRE